MPATETPSPAPFPPSLALSSSLLSVAAGRRSHGLVERREDERGVPVAALERLRLRSSYVPATTSDSDWCGIATGGVLWYHKLPTERCVAFEGINNGRRFYGCAEREGHNCGVVEWVNLDWPVPLKNALQKLWDMYEQSKQDRINDNVDQAEVISKLKEENKHLEEKYSKVVKDLNDFFDVQEKRVQQMNFEKIKRGSEEEKMAIEAQAERAKIEMENNVLKKEVDQLKHIQTAQANVIRNLKIKAAEDMDQLKQEKKKLEYAIAELLQAGEVNKSKIKRIKEICEE